ncbi:MAG: SIMPL domain-containing protein [Polyangiaceae bacterium]
MQSRALSFALVASLVTLAGCDHAAPTSTVTPAIIAPVDSLRSLEHTITVEGTARIEVAPDEACVEITLAARDPAMGAAHRRVSASTEAVAAALGKRGDVIVERGATRYMPQYQTDLAGRTTLTGHLATVQLNVRTKNFGAIPEIVGAASENDLDRVDVVFYSTDIASKKEAVRADALAAARTKAERMAESLHVSLGGVASIAEGGTAMNSSVSFNNYLDRANADQAPDAPAPPGSIPLFMTVKVVYLLGS